MNFTLIKSEDNKDKRVSWNTYELKSNPNIKILAFENIYTIENTQKSGKVIKCGSFDSLYRAKTRALSLNKYLGGK